MHEAANIGHLQIYDSPVADSDVGDIVMWVT